MKIGQVEKQNYIHWIVCKSHVQQQGKSCKVGPCLATPAFAHRNTYCKVKQSADPGLLWDASKRAILSPTPNGNKKHFVYLSKLEPLKISVNPIVNPSPAEPPIVHPPQLPGLPETALCQVPVVYAIGHPRHRWSVCSLCKGCKFKDWSQLKLDFVSNVASPMINLQLGMFYASRISLSLCP